MYFRSVVGSEIKATPGTIFIYFAWVARYDDEVGGFLFGAVMLHKVKWRIPSLLNRTLINFSLEHVVNQSERSR